MMQRHRLINDVFAELIRKQDDSEPAQDQFGFAGQAETPEPRTSAQRGQTFWLSRIVIMSDNLV
jgi:hypothetical protein